jgi:hypothetical protein
MASRCCSCGQCLCNIGAWAGRARFANRGRHKAARDAAVGGRVRPRRQAGTSLAGAASRAGRAAARPCRDRTRRFRPAPAPARLSHRYRQEHPADPVPARWPPGDCPARGVLTRCGIGLPLAARCGSGPEFTGPVQHRARIFPGPVRHRAGIPARPGPPTGNRRRAPSRKMAIITATRTASPKTLNPVAKGHSDNTGRKSCDSLDKKIYFHDHGTRRARPAAGPVIAP